MWFFKINILTSICKILEAQRCEFWKQNPIDGFLSLVLKQSLLSESKLAYANRRWHMPVSCEICGPWHNTVIPWSNNIACVSFHYRANSKWHMPIWGEYATLSKNITNCRKYANFRDRHRAPFPDKEFKAQKHIQNVQIGAMLHSGIFFPKPRSVTVPGSRVLDFSKNSLIRVK